MEEKLFRTLLVDEKKLVQSGLFKKCEDENQLVRDKILIIYAFISLQDKIIDAAKVGMMIKSEQERCDLLAEENIVMQKFVKELSDRKVIYNWIRKHYKSELYQQIENKYIDKLIGIIKETNMNELYKVVNGDMKPKEKEYSVSEIIEIIIKSTASEKSLLYGDISLIEAGVRKEENEESKTDKSSQQTIGGMRNGALKKNIIKMEKLLLRAKKIESECKNEHLTEIRQNILERNKDIFDNGKEICDLRKRQEKLEKEINREFTNLIRIRSDAERIKKLRTIILSKNISLHNTKFVEFNKKFVEPYYNRIIEFKNQKDDKALELLKEIHRSLDTIEIDNDLDNNKEYDREQEEKKVAEEIKKIVQQVSDDNEEKFGKESIKNDKNQNIYCDEMIESLGKIMEIHSEAEALLDERKKKSKKINGSIEKLIEDNRIIKLLISDILKKMQSYDSYIEEHPMVVDDKDKEKLEIELFEQINTYIEMEKKFNYIRLFEVRSNENVEELERFDKARNRIEREKKLENREEGIIRNIINEILYEKGIIASESENQCNSKRENGIYVYMDNPEISIMTYHYIGSKEEKYARGAVVFDSDKSSNIIIDSNRESWNCKKDRTNINKKKVAQGKNLYAYDEKIKFFDQLYVDEREESSKTYGRRKHYFDYRKHNLQEGLKEEKKKYGKISFINDGNNNEICINTFCNLNDCGVVYIDDMNVLKDYLDAK